MINLVIVAGGKQTRYNELSVFPKVLLPSIEQPSILAEIIEKTSKLDVKRYLVINKVYLEQVKTYLNVNNLEDKITLVESTNTCGSLNTLREVKKNLPNENVLFVWSDLSLTSFENIIDKCLSTRAKGIIFANKLGKYRYKTLTYQDMFEDKRENFLSVAEQVADYSGNVPGIYFLRDLHIIKAFNANSKPTIESVDLLDAINEDAKTQMYQVIDLEEIETRLIEYRDLQTYKDLLKGSYRENICQTRFFNKLIVDREHKRVTKKVVDPEYEHLIQKEIEWYKLYDSLNKKGTKCTPTIFSNTEDSFTMEYLDGYSPLHCVLDDFEKNGEIGKIKSLYKNFLNQVSQCQEVSTIDVPFDDFKIDLHKEVVDKVIDRCEKIKGFLISYDRDELQEVLTKTYDSLLSFAMNSSDADVEAKTIRYGFCHGDLNGSNTMVDPKTLDIKFIDPRGYFGKTKTYGWKPYELAKLLYCLYGYDDFNLKPQIYLSDWPQIRQSLEYSGFKEYFHHQDYQHYVNLVGIIYISLGGYISQDIMKANIAYDYGMKILKRNS